MRKLLALLVTVAVIASCEKKSDSNSCGYTDPEINVPDSQVVKLETYLDAHGISATKHPSGFYYTITTQGSGVSPTVCSQIAVKYVGKLSNDFVFDQTTTDPRVFILGQLIPGWKKGLPLIQNTGKITLYLPSALGYGDKDVKDGNGVVVIPANSMLVFDIELIASAPI